MWYSGSFLPHHLYKATRQIPLRGIIWCFICSELFPVLQSEQSPWTTLAQTRHAARPCPCKYLGAPRNRRRTPLGGRTSRSSDAPGPRQRNQPMTSQIRIPANCWSDDRLRTVKGMHSAQMTQGIWPPRMTGHNARRWSGIIGTLVFT